MKYPIPVLSKEQLVSLGCDPNVAKLLNISIETVNEDYEAGRAGKVPGPYTWKEAPAILEAQGFRVDQGLRDYIKTWLDACRHAYEQGRRETAGG